MGIVFQTKNLTSSSTTTSNTAWERMKITMNNILVIWQVALATKQEKD